MAGYSNFKLNKRSNAERPNLPVTKIGNQSTNIRIEKISSSAKYQMDEKLQKLPIFRAKFWFSKLNKF